MKKTFTFITAIIFIGFFPLNSVTITSVYSFNEPWLKVISPDGGEQWKDIQTILWDWGGEVPILPVFFNIYYMRQNEFWQNITIDYANENNTFLWDTHSVYDGQYLIKVELWSDIDLDGDGDTLYMDDISDDWFNINNNDTIDDIPPKVCITKPNYAIYINDQEITSFFTCIIFGYVQIWPHAYDNESGLKFLEFYIDNKLVANYTSIPKSWTWDEPCFGKYTIKLVACDHANNYAICEMTVWKFF